MYVVNLVTKASKWSLLIFLSIINFIILPGNEFLNTFSTSVILINLDKIILKAFEFEIELLKIRVKK